MEGFEILVRTGLIPNGKSICGIKPRLDWFDKGIGLLLLQEHVVKGFPTISIRKDCHVSFRFCHLF